LNPAFVGERVQADDEGKHFEQVGFAGAVAPGDRMNPARGEPAVHQVFISSYEKLVNAHVDKKIVLLEQSGSLFRRERV
jgi:hypothetical protein